jgi:hypothetical protein
VLGLVVNVASVLLLSGGGHHHHGHSHGDHDHDHDEAHSIQTDAEPLLLEIFEDGVPPRFKLSCVGRPIAADDVTIETLRPDGARRVFTMVARNGYLESTDEIPEPHEFVARVSIDHGGIY